MGDPSESSAAASAPAVAVPPSGGVDRMLVQVKEKSLRKGRARYGRI